MEKTWKFVEGYPTAGQSGSLFQSLFLLSSVFSKCEKRCILSEKIINGDITKPMEENVCHMQKQ